MVESCTVDDWLPGLDDTRSGHLTPGPIERWTVLDRGGAIVADSVLSVDEEVALLYGLVSTVSYARWLLHTAIVERLCGRCEVLITNSDDAYLMDPGTSTSSACSAMRPPALRLRYPSVPHREPSGEAPALAEIDRQQEPAFQLAD